MQGMGVWGLAPRSLQISLSSAQPSLSATYRYEKSTPDILYSGGPALISSYAAFPIINGMKFGALTRRKFIDEPDMSPDCSTHFEMDLSQDSGRSTQKRRKHKTSRKKLLADGRRLNTNYSIRRFRTQNRKKTYRVYCFEERDLGIPHRFEKKLKDAAVDNDVTTDSEQVDRCVKHGIASLREAIQQQHQ